MGPRFILTICTLALVLPGCAPGGSAVADGPCAAVVADHAVVERARDHLRPILEREPAPGAAIAVVREGRTLWSESFGSADVDRGEPVCRTTAFRSGSVSKVLTGAALLRMHDTGSVDLEDDVRGLVPGAAWHDAPISLRQLAGHLGGIRHYGQGEYFNTRRYDRVADGLGIFVGDPLQSRPGSTFLYSSYGYNLLGAALEAAAGIPYDEVVRRTVLDPLALRHTHPERALEEGALARPYMLEGDSLVAAPPFDPSDRLPSGGWAASAEDLARLGDALAGDGFLSGPARDLMFRSQRTAANEETGYSVGFRIAKDAAGRTLAHHGGTSVGARAFLLTYPEEGLSIALLVNGPAQYDEHDLGAIAEVFLGEGAPGSR